MDAFDLRHWNGFLSSGGDHGKPALVDQVVIDSRRIHSTQAMFVALKGSHQDGHRFIADSGAKFALVDKDWNGQAGSTQLLKVDDPLSSFQDIVSCYRSQLKGNVIAVIGSYGKTMVKDLLHHLLETTYTVSSSPESFNSQIGVPLSLLNANGADQQIIIEAGFSLPGETEKLHRITDPTHTILTHVGKKHLHTVGSREKIAKEMEVLFPPQDTGWTLLPNDPIIHSPSNAYYWNALQPGLPHATASESQGTLTVQFPSGNAYKISRPPGMSYILDLINIGLKAAFLLEVPEDTLIEALQNYHPEPMSTEIWKSQSGATFVNETYCGDPQSLDCALRHFSLHAPQGKKSLLFGGIKSDDPTAPKRIGEAIGAASPDTLILTSPNQELEKAVLKTSPTTTITQCSSVETALKDHATSMRPEDILIIKGKKKLLFDQLTQAVQGSIFTNQFLINLAAVSSNIKMIRSRLSPSTEVMVMVKAMAYGTQDALIAKYLNTQRITRLGVSYVDEGIALRREGVEQSIFVLNSAPYEIDKAVKWQFELAVNDEEAIHKIDRASSEQRLTTPVHLHIDTGMSRLGCRPEDALRLARIIHKLPRLRLEGVMTHFACSDDPEQDPFTQNQSHVFDQAIQSIENEGIPIPLRHACNSQAALRLHFWNPGIIPSFPHRRDQSLRQRGNHQLRTQLYGPERE